MRRLRSDRRVCLRVKHHLRDAFAVAQIDEEDAAVVANRVHPAEQGNGGAEFGGGKLGTVVGAFHGHVCEGKSERKPQPPERGKH